MATVAASVDCLDPRRSVGVRLRAVYDGAGQNAADGRVPLGLAARLVTGL